MIWLKLTALIFAAGTLVWVWGGLLTWKRAVKQGGRGRHWFFYGLALGPAGLWLINKISRDCPQCLERILREATRCPRCQADIPRMNDEQNPRDPFWSYRHNWSAAEDKAAEDN